LLAVCHGYSSEFGFLTNWLRSGAFWSFVCSMSIETDASGRLETATAANIGARSALATPAGREQWREPRNFRAIREQDALQRRVSRAFALQQG
jgi:hypothetical protein